VWCVRGVGACYVLSCGVCVVYLNSVWRVCVVMCGVYVFVYLWHMWYITVVCVCVCVCDVEGVCRRQPAPLHWPTHVTVGSPREGGWPRREAVRSTVPWLTPSITCNHHWRDRSIKYLGCEYFPILAAFWEDGEHPANLLVGWFVQKRVSQR
jgi:hypothetical protein